MTDLIPLSCCPRCNYIMQLADIAHGPKEPPRSGDCSICFNCGQILTFDAALKLRKASADEVRELMADSEAWAAD